MIKEFVPYELALKLKELGFNEECFGVYYNKDGDVRIYDGNESGDAPLWQQAFDWFREKHKLHYSILGFEYWVAEKIGGFPTGVAKSYEEARLECLKKLIEIVSNKTGK